MPRGVYDRSKSKKMYHKRTTARTNPPKSVRVSLPSDLVDKMRPGIDKGVNLSTLPPLEQTINIPDGGMILKINNAGGRMLVTLDVTRDGMIVYPTNARRGRKVRPRIEWAKLFNLLRVFNW